MPRLSGLLLALLPGLCLAQNLASYNRALSAFNGGELDAAAQQFYELTESGADPVLRAKSEYYLAQSLARKGLPFAAVGWFAEILKAGKAHPYYLKSVEGLVNVQETLGDDNVIPDVLNKGYDEQWSTLPGEVLARINYLIGTISQRKSKFEEARSFLEAVPANTAIYPKAQYLLGVVLSDPRFPGGAKGAEALQAFEKVLAAEGAQKDLVQNKQLAQLAIGRTLFGLGQFDRAVAAYEKVPRFSRYWDQALFENGWARHQNDDLGGALGSLQALHAPQFAGAFQPESWILKATAYYFSCLYAESRTALASFDQIYLPMAAQLKPLVDGNREVTAYYELVRQPTSAQLPQAVLNWVRGNERMQGVFAELEQLDRERALVAGNRAWSGSSRLGADLGVSLDTQKQFLTQVAGALAKRRLEEAYRNLKGFTDQAEIIRFETSKAEKELAEAGVDQAKLLQQQSLFRPAVPAENWNYWKFEGEFWRDEIGYYQYTLKRGCPTAAAE